MFINFSGISLYDSFLHLGIITGTITHFKCFLCKRYNHTYNAVNFFFFRFCSKFFFSLYGKPNLYDKERG